MPRKRSSCTIDSSDAELADSQPLEISSDSEPEISFLNVCSGDTWREIIADSCPKAVGLTVCDAISSNCPFYSVGSFYDALGGIISKAVIDKIFMQCKMLSEFDKALCSVAVDPCAAFPVLDASLFPSDLKGYQLEGISWMAHLFQKRGTGGILADEMGLGKTVQCACLMGYLALTRKRGRFLVVCPSSTLDNWISEVRKWAGGQYRLIKYHGPRSERLSTAEQVLAGDASTVFVFTTYAMATSTADDRWFFRKFASSLLVVDEGHVLKNSSSQLYRHLSKIPAANRLLLTGTPLQNSLLELFSLMRFILPDAFSHAQLEAFDRLFRVSKADGAQVLARIRVDRMRSLFSPFYLRRRKCDVLPMLPEKSQIDVACSMTEYQRKVYSEVSHRGFHYQRKAANHPLLFRRFFSNARLLQLASRLLGLDEYSRYESAQRLMEVELDALSDFECDQLAKKYNATPRLPLELVFESGKVVSLLQILQEERSGEKILIFSQFTSILDILEAVLDAKNLFYHRLDGSTPVDERQFLLERFSVDRVPIFLLSSRAAGCGINLTCARCVVLHDVDFNPQNENQAQDRCHRIGQEQSVVVYRLVCDESVEQSIVSVASIKQRLGAAVVDE